MTAPQRYSDFSPKTIQYLRMAFALAIITVLTAGAFLQAEGHFGLDGTPFFYVWFGAASSVGVIIVANLLRLILRRSETYYEERK